MEDFSLLEESFLLVSSVWCFSAIVNDYKDQL
jgi:hypothetical protein